MPTPQKVSRKGKAHASRSEVTFPAPAAGSQPGHFWLVYLTWNKIAARVEPGGFPSRGKPAILMFISLYDVNLVVLPPCGYLRTFV